MNKKIYRKLISLGLIIALGGCAFSPIQKAEAADLTVASDTLSRLKAAETSVSHTIEFTIVTGLTQASKIQLSTSDFTFAGTPVVKDDTAPVGSPTLSTNIVTIGGTATIGTGSVVEITGLTATNPAIGSYSIEIKTDPNGDGTYTDGDSIKIAVVIITDDQVAVTADIDETISFSLSSTSAALGTMTTSAIASASAITLTMSTNASGGYVITVQDEGDASNPGLYKSTATTKLIASAAVTLAIGVEGYGIQAAAGTGTPTIDAAYLKTGDDVGALSRTAATMVSNTGAASGNTATMTVKAAISAITPAGDYADTLTLICTGTF